MNYKLIAKYIKSLNFNINSPDIFLTLAKDISNYKFKIDIKSNSFKENIIEVETSLSLVPRDSYKSKIVAVATCSALVEIDKNLKDKSKLEEIILVEVPDEIYPELRKIFIFIFETSGFREINIDENVNFRKLYISKKN